MLDRIEHVAFAVADLDAAIEHYAQVWGLRTSHRDRVDDQSIEEAMLPIGDSNIQLVSPTSPTSTVARFLEQRGEGLHHIAYEVDDIAAALDRLRAEGAELIDDVPRAGGRGHLVAFVHPNRNHGVLVELVQARAPA